LETIIGQCGYRMYQELGWTIYGYAPIVFALGDADQPRRIELGRLDKLLSFYPQDLEEGVTRMLADAAYLMNSEGNSQAERSES
jgi:hypothetical protein